MGTPQRVRIGIDQEEVGGKALCERRTVAQCLC
jgi:hypothetical protein